MFVCIAYNKDKQILLSCVKKLCHDTTGIYELSNNSDTQSIAEPNFHISKQE